MKENTAPVPTTPEDFLTKSPLFTKVKTENFHAPTQLKAYCNEACKSETDWFQIHKPTALGKGCEDGEVADWKTQSVAYKCFRCRKATLTVVYTELETEKRSHPPRMGTGFSRLPPPPPPTFDAVVLVMKVGQQPPPAIQIPKGLETNLGTEAAGLYKKALLCRNSGFGLAAVSYMRRVVEDKTNELIRVAAEFADVNNMGQETVDSLLEIASSEKYTPYEDKLKIAASVFPEKLKVGDVNPLSFLFGRVSKSLHGLGEDACLLCADEIRTVFEYVFENLRAEISSRRAFTENVKKLLS